MTVVPKSDNLMSSVHELGAAWHGAGTLPDPVLDEIARIGRDHAFTHTMETGCGRSTILLSNISAHHLVFTFAASDTHFGPDDSYGRVSSSPLFRADTTQFILGPTQRTVPQFAFDEKFDFVLLDGPHSYPFPDLEYYFVYRHIKPGGYLVIDDIWIASIHNLFSFLKEDPMFRLEKVVANTAFFVRTDALTFDPMGDDWAAQPYNKSRFPVQHTPPTPFHAALPIRLLRRLPQPAKNALKRIAARENRVRLVTAALVLSAAAVANHRRHRP